LALDAAQVDLAARRGVQRPVVRADQDAPQLRVREVGELRAVVEAQQRDEGKDDVAVARLPRLVGMCEGENSL
jgi:hypothetical protein